MPELIVSINKNTGGEKDDPNSPPNSPRSDYDSLRIKMDAVDELKTRSIRTRITHNSVESLKGSNAVSSTKYTLLSWLPITLAVQFRRLANIYFLMLSTLMLIGTYAPWIFRSPLEPMSTISTLVMVLMVTSCKEGYDDLQRWEADNVENKKPVTLLKWNQNDKGEDDLVEVTVEQKDICPGDIVKLTGKCRVPCDLVLMHTSCFEEGNACYVETSNIDGETSLKCKKVPAAVSASLPYLLKRVPVQGQTSKKIQTIMEPTSKLFDGEIEVEPPNNLIYSFIGALHLHESSSVPALESVPLSAENLLLRSSVVCNTDWAIGVCVYSGGETKIQMNNRLTPLKLSNLEKYANKAVICVFLAQSILVTTAVIGFFFMGYDNFQEKLPYIYPEAGIAAVKEGVDVGENTSERSVLPLWLEQWIIFLILFNNFIPISLYVTMELVNLGQSDLAANDVEMYDEKLNKCCVVKTGNLLQELGQIAHVFSDKTGTLTKNEMKLKYFTVANINVNVDDGIDHVSDSLMSSVQGAEHLHDFCRCLVLCHTVVREQEKEEELVKVEESVAIGILQTGLSAIRRRLTSFESISSGFQEAVHGLRRRLGSNDSREGATSFETRQNSVGDLDGYASRGTPTQMSRSRSNGAGSASPASDTPGSSPNQNTKKTGTPVTQASPQTVAGTPAIPEGENEDKDGIKETDSTKFDMNCFFGVNAPSGAKEMLISAEHCDSESPKSIPERGHRAESPDELALVLGTRRFHCQFVDRVHNLVEVDIIGQGRVKYEQLVVNAFDSDRKRMSVLMCNRQSNEYILFCKGADVTMLPLLHINGVQRDKTEMQLRNYALDGFRTLVIAHRKVSEEVALKWLAEYREAGLRMTNRAKHLAKCADNMERDLELLGITAIEDKLQDDVSAVISDLSRAGVTTWMLTGDKEETAVNIGMSCNLLIPSTEVHNLTNISTASDLRKHLHKIYTDIDPLTREAPSEQQQQESTVPGPDLRHPIVVDLGGGTGIETTCQGKLLDEPFAKLADCDDATTSLEDIELKESVPVDPSKIGEYMNLPQSEAADNGKLSKRSPTTSKPSHALVIDGPSFALFNTENAEDRLKLLGIGSNCRAVIGCRLTPLQKAQLVELVKKGTIDMKLSKQDGGHERVLTLAIGDGANDVPMIQEADVGVGIFGKEGNQAANNADFAIAQFKFLRRLMLVHGRSNYISQVDVCMYCLHKNMVLTLTLFWYSYYTSLSGTSLYESWIYSAFNLALGLPIIFYGILDKDLTQEFVLQNPEVYETSRTNSRLTNFQMLGWFVNGLFYAMVICNLSYIAFTQIFESQALYIMGTTVWTGLVMSLQGKVAYMSHFWAWPQVWCMTFSIGAMFPYFVFASYGSYAFYKQAVHLFEQWDFWLIGMFTVPVVCVVLVDVLWNAVRLFFWPSKEMLFKEVQNQDIYNTSDCEQFHALWRTNLRLNASDLGMVTTARDHMEAHIAKMSNETAYRTALQDSSVQNIPIASARVANTVIRLPDLELPRK